MTVHEICSITEIASYNTPLSSEEWGILALDFDQTLVQPRSLLAGESFYQFLAKMNPAHSVRTYGHDQWIGHLRLKVPYDTCEPVEKVNRLVEEYRRNGWSVRVLTSRGVDKSPLVEKNLKETQLAFRMQDVIYKTIDQTTNQFLAKDQNLLLWMIRQPQWERCKTIRILFVDDSDKYCQEVLKVAAAVERAAVRCFHYGNPSPPLSLPQLQRQLCDYAQLSQIEGDEEAIYQIAKKVAEKEQFPFLSRM